MKLIPYKGIKVVRVKHHDRVWGCPLETDVQRIWDQNLKEAETANAAKTDSPKISLFNGHLARVISMHQTEGALHIDTEETDYAHHVATRGNQDLNSRANPLYAAILITLKEHSGKKYQVFGYSAGTEVQYQGKLNLVAGSVHPRLDRVGKNLNVDLALERELEEELGLSYMRFSGGVDPSFVAVEEDMQHPSVVYTGTLPMSRDELKRHHQEFIEMESAAGRHPEFSGLHFVENHRKAILDEIEKGKFHNRVNVILKHYASSLRD